MVIGRWDLTHISVYSLTDPLNKGTVSWTLNDLSSTGEHILLLLVTFFLFFSFKKRVYNTSPLT